ncbi:MAG: hypothetical protein CMH59_18435 [Myxococcales bacterium]|nr:hypothetical protein [Myxococcales bacterium]
MAGDGFPFPLHAARSGSIHSELGPRSRAVRDHRRLEVWRLAHETCVRVFQVTRGFPSRERYGLAAELRRSATSVPSNIAEGYGRGTPREIRQFLRIASGSLSELDEQLLIARDVGLLDDVAYDELEARVRRQRPMLWSLRRYFEGLCDD